MVKGVSKKTKQEVLERDNYMCQACHSTNPDKLTMHHIVYLSQGGARNKKENLITLCTSCHKDEHRKDPEHTKKSESQRQQKLKEKKAKRKSVRVEVGMTETIIIDNRPAFKVKTVYKPAYCESCSLELPHEFNGKMCNNCLDKIWNDLSNQMVKQTKLNRGQHCKNNK